ncbi:hypothetical protein E4U40_001074 [Claviceps sp. LM458 group G5]|nr:hypothetical protein E4U40_001074 [Claviceps sp. LM458 group G5]
MAQKGGGVWELIWSMERRPLKLEVWLRKSPYKEAIQFRSSVERMALSQNGRPSIGWQGWDWDGDR